MLSAQPFDREIVGLAVPALGSLAAEPLYVLVDTAIVGHLGTPQLGGLAVAGTVLTTAFLFFNFLAYGTTAAVARLVGAGRREEAVGYAVQALWIAGVVGAVLTVAGAMGAPGAVSLMGASGAVRPHAETYLRISAFGAPAVLVALAGMGYLRGRQDTRTPFVIAIASNVGNLLIEIWLVYGLDLGIAGSAWGTVAAQWAAAVAYLVVMLRDIRGASTAMRPNLDRLRAIASVAKDLMVRTGSLLAALAGATAVASRQGTANLGAHQIAFQLWIFLALVLDALAIAGQAMIGRFLGASDADAARAAGRRLIELGVLTGAVFAAGVALLRPALVPLFSDDAGVASRALDVLWIVALLQPLNAVVFVLDGVLIGAGDQRFLARAMAGAALGVFLPAAVLVHVVDLGLLALWGALVLLMVARLASNLARFAGDRWLVTGAVRAR